MTSFPKYAVLLLTLSLTRPAAAAPVVTTPPIPRGLAGVDAAICQAINLGNKPAAVTVEIVNAQTGEVLGSQAATINPGRFAVGFYESSTVPTSYCRVIGLSRAKTKVSFGHVIDNPGAMVPVLFVTAP